MNEVVLVYISVWWVGGAFPLLQSDAAWLPRGSWTGGRPRCFALYRPEAAWASHAVAGLCCVAYACGRFFSAGMARVRPHWPPHGSPVASL